MRHALREQIAARERIERQLEEARSAIQALETQLAHERIAKDEALRHAEDWRQEVEHQLEQGRTARQQAEHDRDEAITRRREAEERLLEVMATKMAPEPSSGPERAQRSRKGDNSAGVAVEGEPEVGDTVPAQDAASQMKLRGRPPKTRDEETEFVEWWKPGWRDRFQ